MAAPLMIALASDRPALPRAVALKALARIAGRWQLRRSDLAAILRRPERTLRDWFERDRGPLEGDALERIVHLIGIFDGLHRLFGDEAYADRWIHTANSAFGNTAPIELLRGGSFTTLVEVHRYIEEALTH